ncbi:MAG TPA: hypothetical protein VFS79_00215 [Arthrobacter sp.]|nr:hypothetical protein [Arthrobacter sp.]
MPAKWSAGRRRARLRATAASLTLPLWLGACVVQGGQESTQATSAPLPINRSAPAAVQQSLTPAPQPKDGAPATPDTPAPPLDESSSSPAAVTDESATAAPATGSIPENRAAQGSVPAGPADGEAIAGTVTAYYVLVDDGGRNGVRFGCNDSLVGIVHASSGEEALPAAIRALLDPPGGALPAHEPEAYNALSRSRLKFLSGSFDGTTVTVYLAGVLRPGGTCDVPRMEAQLTQTAVAAAGAIRAEIYVNGRSLAEALELD